ncbi:MAG: ABC transporter substrate-binding protein [Firmicutes bacterium]|nr:ABC transporter substrate-binding protein [Bacillota bacterium]
MRKWISILLVLSLALFALGCQGSTKEAASSSGTTEANKEPYKIGAVVSATGPSSPLGLPEKNTLELEVEKINKAGGINGHKLELIIEDDQSDAKNAVTAVSKLIDKEKVIAVIAATISPSSIAVKPEIAKAKIPQMAMAAGIPITQDDPKEWVFRTANSDAVAVQKVIDYLSKDLKVKKIAILSDTNAFGQSGTDEFKKLAPKAGLDIVIVERYQTQDTNMTAQLTKIKGTDAEALVVWGTNPGPAQAAKNMKELGMTIPYVGSHGIANKTFIQLAGGAAEGVVFPAGKVLVPSSAKGEQAEVINKFMSDYKAKYNENPNSFAGHAYDAINILAEALKKAGTSDGVKLRDAIEKTSGFVGITGIFNYSKDNHDGTGADDMVMIEIKEGKWVEKK